MAQSLKLQDPHNLQTFYQNLYNLFYYTMRIISIIF